MAYANPENISNLAGLATHANTLVGGNLGWVILLGWGIISMVALSQRYDEKSAFVITMFQLSIFGVLFRTLSLVNDFIMYFIIILTLIGVGIAVKQ